MDPLEIVILLCCIVCVILLIVLLMKKTNGNAAEQEIRRLEQALEQLSDRYDIQNKQLMDQSVRQNDSVVHNISILGDSLRDANQKQQAAAQETLAGLRTEMQTLRTSNQESLDKINGIITEKMQSTLDEKLNQAFETVVKNMTELGRQLNEGQEKQQRAASEKLLKLEGDFERIRHEILETLDKVRKSNTESMEKLRQENQQSLDRINATVNEKLQKTLDDKLTRSFAAVNERLADVHKGLGEMRSVASGVTDLKNILSNVKTRGMLGEIQLGAILGEILSPEQYAAQVPVRPRSAERVDFAIKMPGNTEGESIWLPIDSKFPGDTYSNLLAAYESETADQIKLRRNQLVAEVKRCAKSISEKYIAPPDTTNFAIMFLPFEGLYAEVINLGLVEVLQRDYHVNIAGPSTMAAMLNSLQMGFRTLAIQKKSGEVWKILEAAKQEFGKFEGVLEKVRANLQKTDEELEKLIGVRTRAITKKLRSVEITEGDSSAEDLLDMDDAE